MPVSWPSDAGLIALGWPLDLLNHKMLAARPLEASGVLFGHLGPQKSASVIESRDRLRLENRTLARFQYRSSLCCNPEAAAL